MLAQFPLSPFFPSGAPVTSYLIFCIKTVKCKTKNSSLYVLSISFVSFHLSLSSCLYQGSFLSNHSQHFLVSIQLTFPFFYVHISKASSLFLSSLLLSHVCDPCSMTLHSTGFYHPFLLISVQFSSQKSFLL